jgi:hypothetical protein
MRAGLKTRLLVGPICVSLLLTLGARGPAYAVASCITPHCYAVVERTFTKGASEVWATLTTFCMSNDGYGGDFTNNEIWTRVTNTSDYVEFGQTYDPMPGLPTRHWFWARTISGVQQGFDLNVTYYNSVSYKATVRWTGAGGSWKFLAGTTTLASGPGATPSGPIMVPILGAETGSLTLLQQNSIYDNNAGRIQNGTTFSTWAVQGWLDHDVPPFDSSGYWGDTYVNDQNPSVGGAGGC